MAAVGAKRVSAVDACEARLRGSILDGTYGPGSRLPPERTLAESFGVNRTTLRSALTRLTEAGLVTSRQGDGCLVRDYRETAGLELVSTLLERAPTREERLAIARDLLAIRRAVALVVLERLIDAPPTRQTRANARRAARNFEVAVERGDDVHELARLDLELLTELIDASDSPVVRLLVNPVSRLLGGFEELTVALYADPPRNVLAHRAVLAWLDGPSRDSARALVSAMEAHDKEALSFSAGTSKSTPRRARRR